MVTYTMPVVTLATAADGTRTNALRPTFSGSAGTASGDDSAVTIKVFKGSDVLPTQTLSAPIDGTGHFSAPATADLAEGDYTVVASQSNSTSGATGSVTTHFAEDRTAPTVTLTSPANGTQIHAVTFSGAAGSGPGDNALVTMWNGTSVGAGAPEHTFTATAAAGAYSTGASLPDGTYTARAGTARIKVRLTPAGKKRLAEGRAVQLLLETVFTPTGRKPVLKTQTVKLKAKRR